jgi:Cyclic nucleotide-binding domain
LARRIAGPYRDAMRVESRVTSVSWIPSEAVSGPMKAGFTAGVSHYDRPPPGRLGNLSEMREDDAFRFANELIAWAEFEGATPTRYGQRGGQVLGSTTIRLGPLDATFAAVPMPDLRPDPVVEDVQVTFTQTVGGRTALPIPRRTSKPPYLRLQPPLVWTTLRLTLRADGSATPELAGASPFPRHWVYDASGAVAFKAGVADWRTWLGQPSWTATPWGEQDSPVVVAAAESELERELSTVLMHGARQPKIRRLNEGEVLTEQGAPGDSLFLLLDGILDVTHDGRSLGPLGPGAIVGERAVLEATPRTATLTALTRVTVAEAPADTIDRQALGRLAEGHRRELAFETEPE